MPQKIVEDPGDNIRLGNFVTKVPDNLPIPKSLVVSGNQYSSFAEAKLAQFFRSIGYSDKESDRRAATAVVTGFVGGVAAAIAVGVPTFLAVSLFTVPGGTLLGLGIGSVVPPTGLNTLTGAAIGAGAGAGVAAAAALAAAAAAGVLGAVAGAAVGWAIGGGDANQTPTPPWEQPEPAPEPPAPINPEADQYQMVLAPQEAADAGLPAVSYTVNTQGDVAISANVGGGAPITGGWTGEQAEAPLEALGPLEQAGRDVVAGVTDQINSVLPKVLPGVQISHPQMEPAA